VERAGTTDAKATDPRAFPGRSGRIWLRPTPAGPVVVGGAGFYGLHAQGQSGVLHIESPVVRRFTLGEFFDVWGQPFGRYTVGPAR
jgi:hypothetical protein